MKPLCNSKQLRASIVVLALISCSCAGVLYASMEGDKRIVKEAPEAQQVIHSNAGTTESVNTKYESLRLQITEQIEETTQTETEPMKTEITETTPEVTEALETVQENIYTENDIELIAKTLWGECRSVAIEDNKAAVVWCILNRVDAGKSAGFGDTIEEVVTAPWQFHGYNENNPVSEDLVSLAEDVLQRWQREKNGETDVGRVLPKEYYWFHGDMKTNHFRDAYTGAYNVWNWSMESPYSDK